MESSELNVVTGAFGYTGRYITNRLLLMGQRVRTLTGRPNRPNPFGRMVRVAPFNFDSVGEMIKSLRGATTLYNTYWIRFPRSQVTFDRAIQNTKVLIQAAEEAGVRRIVHISITNPSEESPLPYFRGKAIVEKAIIDSGLSYAIIRPAVIFGSEDVLINNIAWLLRRFPVFAVLGSGSYRLQPVFAEDVAQLAIGAADQDENLIMDAVGPEIYTFDELVRLVAEKVDSRAKIMHLPPGLALFFSRLVGYLVRDVVLTRDEVEGLMSELLVSQGAPTGTTRLSDWLSQNAGVIGIKYTSELKRHYR